eukprot:ANDGO_00166.mRNA.1 hypothetical protein
MMDASPTAVAFVPTSGSSAVVYLRNLLREKDEIISELEEDNREYEKTVSRLASFIDSMSSVAHKASDIIAASAGSPGTHFPAGSGNGTNSPAKRKMAEISQQELDDLRLRASKLERQVSIADEENESLRQENIQCQRTLEILRREMEISMGILDRLAVSSPHRNAFSDSPDGKVASRSPGTRGAEDDSRRNNNNSSRGSVDGASVERLSRRLEDVFFDLQKQNLRLSTENKELRSTAERARAEVIQLSSSIRSMSEENVSVAALKAETEFLRRQMTDLESRCQRLQGERDRAADDVLAMKSEREVLQQDAAALRRELGVCRDQSSLHVQSRSSLERELEKARSEVNAAQSQVSDVKKKLADLQSQYQTLESDHAALQKQHSIVEAVSARVQAECAEHRSLATDCEATIGELMSEVRQLSDTLASSEERSRSVVADFEVQRSDFVSKVSKLSTEGMRLERQVLEREDRIAELENKLSEANRNVGEEQARTMEAQRHFRDAELKWQFECDGLRSDCGVLRARLDALQSDAHADSSALRDRIRILEQERDRLAEELGSMSSRRDALERTVVAAAEEHALWDNETRQLAARLGEAEDARSMLERKVDVLITHLNRLHALEKAWDVAKQVVLSGSATNAAVSSVSSPAHSPSRDRSPAAMPLDDVDVKHVVEQMTERWVAFDAVCAERDEFRDAVEALESDANTKHAELTRLLALEVNLKSVKKDAEAYQSLAESATSQHERLLALYQEVSQDRDDLAQKMEEIVRRNEVLESQASAAQQDLQAAHGECAELASQMIRWLNLAQQDNERDGFGVGRSDPQSATAMLVRKLDQQRARSQTLSMGGRPNLASGHLNSSP